MDSITGAKSEGCSKGDQLQDSSSGLFHGLVGKLIMIYSVMAARISPSVSFWIESENNDLSAPPLEGHVSRQIRASRQILILKKSLRNNFYDLGRLFLVNKRTRLLGESETHLLQFRATVNAGPACEKQSPPRHLNSRIIGRDHFSKTFSFRRP